MTDDVAQWAASARNAEVNFFPTVARALDQFNQGNRSDLFKLLCVVNGKKSRRVTVIEGERLKFAPHLKRIIEAAAEGFEYKSFKYDPPQKKGESSSAYAKRRTTFGVSWNLEVEVGNAGFNTDMIEGLRMLANKTVQSPEYKKAFPVVNKKATERSEKSVVETAIRAAKKLEGMTEAKFEKMVRALWNETK